MPIVRVPHETCRLGNGSAKETAEFRKCRRRRRGGREVNPAALDALVMLAAALTDIERRYNVTLTIEVADQDDGEDGDQDDGCGACCGGCG